MTAWKDTLYITLITMAIGFSKEQQTGSGNKKIKVEKKKFPKKTGEMEVFKLKWKLSDCRCENCRMRIIAPTVSNFAHIRPKSTHNELRLEVSNLMLLCVQCHDAYDKQGKEKYNSRKNIHQ